MIGIGEVPEQLLKFIFNLGQGRHVDTICKKCNQVTDQVIISYELLPLLRDAGFDLALIGRLMDIVPFMPVLVGRPTICRCGTVNR